MTTMTKLCQSVRRATTLCPGGDRANWNHHTGLYGKCKNESGALVVPARVGLRGNSVSRGNYGLCVFA